MNLTYLLFAISSVVISSAIGCEDKGANCKYMTSFCFISTFAKYWCKKSCDNCGTTPTNPPTTVPATTTTTTEKPPVFSGCGRPAIQHGKVIAGDDAVAHSWPWQILIVKQGYPSCGGAIIDPNWIVTAAHCIDTRLSSWNYIIRAGDHNLRYREGHEEDYNVEKMIVHPSWNPRNVQNDIAMIKLRTPIKFNRYISPVCLPESDTKVGQQCYISGWGKIEHPGQMHSILQQAKMPVITNDVCHNYNYPYTRIRITSGMVCGGHGGRTDVSGCHGDSGGPFVCNNRGTWELHGAVSHGSMDCDADKTYTVFSRVYAYKTWIKNTMYYN